MVIDRDELIAKTKFIVGDKLLAFVLARFKYEVSWFSIKFLGLDGRRLTFLLNTFVGASGISNRFSIKFYVYYGISNSL